MVIAEGDITHTRLNYWLVTEGLLLAGFGAASNVSFAESSWSVRIGLSFGGIFFTFAWHSIYLRSWAWYDWWLRRFQALNARRLGITSRPNVVPPWGVAIPQGYLDFWRGEGLSTRKAVDWLMIAFLLLWSLFLGLSWFSLLGWNLSAEGTLAVILVAVWFGYAGVVLRIRKTKRQPRPESSA